MRIGVISDTHGMLDRTRQAVELFDREGIDTVLHCGDVGGLPILEQFVGKRFWFVWGNTDRIDLAAQDALQIWGFPWPERSPLTIDLDGKRIILAHGHESSFRYVFRNPDADFLFFGHSHSRLCVRIGHCMVVNPGAIQRTPLPTVAVVDLQSAEVSHLDLHGRRVESE